MSTITREEIMKKKDSDLTKEEREIKYNRSKNWQLFVFSLAPTANLLFMMTMGYVSYYATGVAGLGTAIVSTALTGTTILDGILDPIVGFIADRTDGKFGKVRPLLVIGYLIMLISLSILFFTTHLIPTTFRFPYFFLFHVIYTIGYTATNTGSWIGMNVISNDPEQRTLYGTINAAMNMAAGVVISIYISAILAPRHGGLNNMEFFTELILTVFLFAGIFYLLAILVIRKKDNIENFGTGELDTKISIKEMFTILRKNKQLQLLIIAGATDKLGIQVNSNSILGVLLFGVIIGDYALMGQLSLLTLIPSVIILIIGMGYAKKTSTRKGYIVATVVSMIVAVFLVAVLVLGDPTQISLTNISFMTIAFLILFSLRQGLQVLSTGIIGPMLQDIVDYEVYRSGRYAPGTVTMLYGLIDKISGSFSHTIVGLVMAFIGFREVFPDVDTPYSTNLLIAWIVLSVGIMMVAWVISLIAMKYYKLDKVRMGEIRIEIDRRKEEIKKRKAAEVVNSTTSSL
ncbi:MAG TPA: MFS transporter [Atopostipes sp.]|nr:MFS transporter [Atopostipes sp.]